MAAEIFTAISALRMVLDSETDADSPDNETTFAAMRVGLESLFMILLSTGFSGTVTGISTTTITHADAPQGTDTHNGRTTVMTSGACKGNFYTIDDTTDQTLVHTDDDPEADGVAIGDTFVVLYDIKVNTTGHDHDDVNSPAYNIPAGSIVNTKLDTDTGTASTAIATNVTATIVMQPYTFFPNIYGTAPVYFQMWAYTVANADQTGRFAVRNVDGSTRTYTCNWRYISASNDPFIYALMNTDTGEIVASWACGDPPHQYYGMSVMPDDFEPPIALSDPQTILPEPPAPIPDPKPNMEHIAIFKYPKHGYDEIINKSNTDKMPIHELINDNYDYNSSKKLFITKNLVHI